MAFESSRCLFPSRPNSSMASRCRRPIVAVVVVMAVPAGPCNIAQLPVPPCMRLRLTFVLDLLADLAHLRGLCIEAFSNISLLLPIPWTTEPSSPPSTHLRCLRHSFFIQTLEVV